MSQCSTLYRSPDLPSANGPMGTYLCTRAAKLGRQRRLDTLRALRNTGSLQSPPPHSLHPTRTIHSNGPPERSTHAQSSPVSDCSNDNATVLIEGHGQTRIKSNGRITCMDGMRWKWGWLGCHVLSSSGCCWFLTNPGLHWLVTVSVLCCCWFCFAVLAIAILSSDDSSFYLLLVGLLWTCLAWIGVQLAA